jgi:hypothetical protein
MHEPKSYRRRMLLVIALLVALPLGWLGWQVSIVRHRQAMRSQIEASGGKVFTPGPLASIEGDISTIRRMLGDEFTHQIFLRGDSRIDEREVAESFPEARIVPIAPGVR